MDPGCPVMSVAANETFMECCPSPLNATPSTPMPSSNPSVDSSNIYNEKLYSLNGSGNFRLLGFGFLDLNERNTSWSRSLTWC